MLDGLERLIHGTLKEADEQVIHAVLKAVARVALDRLAVLVEKRQGFGVIRDHVIQTKEDIEFMQLELIRVGINRRAMKDHVDVFSPVVNLGDVGFIDRVFDGQGMKPEDVPEEASASWRAVSFGFWISTQSVPFGSASAC